MGNVWSVLKHFPVRKWSSPYRETFAIVVDLNGSGSAVVVDSRSSNVPERWCQEARNGGLGCQEFLVVHVCILGSEKIAEDEKGKELS